MDGPSATHRADVVAAFARDLSQMRDLAGAPSYRRLAAVTHFAPSTLAEALRGRRLPTEAVVRALAGACDSDVEHWVARWRTAVAESRRVPAAVVEVSPPTDVVEVGGAVEVGPAGRAGRPDHLQHPARRRFGAALVAAALAALVVVAGLSGVVVGRGTAPAGAPQGVAGAAGTGPSVAPAVQDGGDPETSGCARDARVLARADLRGDDATTGRLEIRWSLHCGVVWATLDRAGAPWPARTDAQVTLTTSDGRSASYTVPMVPVTTAMFRLGQFCASAQAVAHDPDFRGQAVASTACVTP